MAKEYKSLVLKLGVDGRELLRGLEKADKSLRGTSGELVSLKKALSELKWDSSKFTRAQDVAQERVKGTSEKVKKLKEMIAQLEQANVDKTTDQFKALEKALVDAEVGAKKARQELEAVNNMNFDRITSKINKVSDGLKGAGKALMPVSAATGAALAFSAKAAIDYEQAFVGVRKTVDATEPELQALNDRLREMSKELPSTAVELANYATVAGQMGVQTQNIAGFVDTMAKLKVATNIDGEEGALLISQFANVAQMGETEFGNLGSAVTDLGNKFATTEQPIMEMAERIVGAGYTAHMSEADVLGLSAGLSSLGLEARAGGSSVSKLINNINGMVQTGSEDLKKYADIAGMSAQSFAKAFKEDAAGAITTFIEGLGKAGDSAIPILEEIGITEIRMRDALLRSANAGNEIRRGIETANTAWRENIALNREAEKAAQSKANQMQITKNQITDLGIDIGNLMLPLVRDLLGEVRDLTAWFRNLDDGTQKTIIKVLGLTAALSPLLTTVGMLGNGMGSVIRAITGTVAKLVAYKTATGAATVVQAAFNAVCDANPILLLVSALGIMIGALSTYALVAGDATLSTQGMADKINDLAEEADNLKNSFDDAVKSARDMEVSTIANIEAAREHIPRLQELADKTNRTASEQAEMQIIIDGLNDAIPGLALAIDGETGALSRQISVIYAACDAYIALARAKAAQTIMEEAYVQSARAKYAREENQKELQSARTQQRQAQQEGTGLTKQQEDAAALRGISVPPGDYTAEEWKQINESIKQGEETDQKLKEEQERAEKQADQARKDYIDQTEAAKKQMPKGLEDGGDTTTDKPYSSGGTTKSGSGGSGGGSKASSSSRDAERAAQEAEKARQDKIKAYKDQIAEAERIEDRHTKFMKETDQLTDEQELQRMNDKLKRYQTYMQDVMKLDYLTEEERQELLKQYREEAEDTYLDIYQKQKEIQAKKEKLLQEERDKQLKVLEEVKQASLNAIQERLSARQKALDAEEAYALEIIDEKLKAEEKLLQAKLDAIDEEIEARRRLREDQSQEDEIATLNKKILATKKQLEYARDQDQIEQLTRELNRQNEDLNNALQDKEDTLFFREKEAEKEKINDELELLREKAEAQKDLVSEKYEERRAQAQAEADAKQSQTEKIASATSSYVANNNYDSKTTNNTTVNNTVVIKEDMPPEQVKNVVESTTNYPYFGGKNKW